MNTRQKNKLKMFITTKQTCDMHSGIWSGIPAFANGVNELGQKIIQIETLRLEQEQNIKGYTIERLEKKRDLAMIALRVAEGMAAYAAVIDDDVLEKEIDFSFSRLYNVRDAMAKSRATYILEKANSLLGVLADYGIDSNILTELETKIAEFDDIVKRKQYIEEYTQSYTVLIRKAFRETSKILRDVLDRLILIFYQTNYDFYLHYIHAREIYDLGGGTGGGGSSGSTEFIVKFNKTTPGISQIGVGGTNGFIVNIDDGNGNIIQSTFQGNQVDFIQLDYPMAGVFNARVFGDGVNELKEFHVNQADIEDIDIPDNAVNIENFIAQDNGFSTTVSDKIVIKINSFGTDGTGKVINLIGNGPLSAAGLQAKAELEARGWTVLVS